MTLRLLTTTVASVQLAIWASCKTDFFTCTAPTPPPPKKEKKFMQRLNMTCFLKTNNVT